MLGGGFGADISMFSDNFRRGEGKGNGKTGSKAVSKLADIGWKAFQAVNSAVPEGKSIQPAWAAEPLLKSYERTAPPLGFPRETDSLCPSCVKSVRSGVISGDIPLDILMNSHPGEIKAQIVEENGQVFMRKTCPTHGEFEDVLATDADFLRRIEGLFYGRDFKAAEDSHVHHHGTSDIKFGRGAVLTVDLTNRCNMMCNPCFMDANQVGYVHEPTFEDTKAILDRAVSFKPRRQIIILFSGGEPTLSGPLDLVVVDDDLGGPYPPGPSDWVARALGRELAGRYTGGSRIVLVFAEPRAWKGRAGLGAASREALASYAPDADLIVLFGHARLVDQIPSDAPVLLAWHRQRLLQEAVARWLRAHLRPGAPG